MTAVEIDPRLAGLLPQHRGRARPATGRRPCTVITADALDDHRRPARLADPELAAPPDPTALVANLPYNVAVPVLLHLLAELPTLRRVLVMVQAEVADRLAAARVRGPTARPASRPPGTARRGGPARSAGRCSGRSRASTPRWWRSTGARTRGPPTGAAVFAVIDAAFAQRRKTLRSALAGWAGSPALRRDGAAGGAESIPRPAARLLGVDDVRPDRRRPRRDRAVDTG